MTSDQGITRELSLREVVSKTFELYHEDSTKHFVLFVVVEIVIGLVTTFAYDDFPLPSPPPQATSQQALNWLSGFFGNPIALITTIGLVLLVLGTIALGSTIKMASEEIEGRPVELGGVVLFVATKLLQMWMPGRVVGIFVGLGSILIILGESRDADGDAGGARPRPQRIHLHDARWTHSGAKNSVRMLSSIWPYWLLWLSPRQPTMKFRQPPPQSTSPSGRPLWPSCTTSSDDRGRGDSPKILLDPSGSAASTPSESFRSPSIPGTPLSWNGHWVRAR